MEVHYQISNVYQKNLEVHPQIHKQNIHPKISNVKQNALKVHPKISNVKQNDLEVHPN